VSKANIDITILPGFLKKMNKEKECNAIKVTREARHSSRLIIGCVRKFAQVYEKSLLLLPFP